MKRASTITVAVCSALIAALFIFNIVIHYLTIEEVKQRRPIPFFQFPAKDVQPSLGQLRMRAVTTVEIDDTLYQFSTGYNKDTDATRHEVPEAFMEGVMYGVSAWHRENQQRNDSDNISANLELLREIRALDPPPDQVFFRVSESTVDEWVEEGFILHFYEDTKAALFEARFLGRAFGQLTMYKWWVHRWGKERASHSTMMQMVVPVAGAVTDMKHSSAVRMHTNKKLLRDFKERKLRFWEQAIQMDSKTEL